MSYGSVQVAGIAGVRSSANLLIDAIGDPRRSHRSVLILISIYVLLWWAYAVVAKGTQGIHFDMGEVSSWSQHPAVGYLKHPPFPAWVAMVWFAVFPRSDWAYYLLSVTSVGVALWFIFLIIERLVDSGEKRVVALLFFFFAPIFNFHPLKFNSNALLIPVWAAATWLFLRSFQERTLFWGTLAGIGAAIAMLTKYWSFFLIFGFVAAALFDPRRDAYFRSPAPWSSVLAGAVVLAPNIIWMFEHNFGPFHYATTWHSLPTHMDSIVSVFHYLSGVLYLAGGFLALAIAAKPDATAWLDMLCPRQGDRRLLLIVTLTSLLAPVGFALVLKMRVDPLWTMPCWAGLSAMLLSSTRITVTREAAITTMIAGYIVAVLALAASPVIAMVILRGERANSAVYYPLIAEEADRVWRRYSDKPLRYVTGRAPLAWACSFYCSDHPSSFGGSSFEQELSIDRDDMLRRGFVGLCEAVDDRCLAQVRELAAAATIQEETAELTRHAFGLKSQPRRFTVIVALPAQAPGVGP